MFVLFAVFVSNWAPVPSVDIFVFGIIPIAAFAFHKVFAWTVWAAAPFVIICGFLLLYLAIAPLSFLANWELFFVDLFGGLVFGGLVFLAFDRISIA